MIQTTCKLEQRMVDEHRVLTMENQWLRVSVDIDRGAHIFEISDRKTGINVLYQDPKGPARHDVGGWYELFPNAGRGCVFGEIDIPGHGDVRDLPWSYEIVQQTASCIQLRLQSASKVLPFKIEKTLTLLADQPNLFVREQITNTGAESSPYLWGHHVTFGEPFIDHNCRIDLPQSRVYKRPDYGNDDSQLAAEASGTLQAMPGNKEQLVDLTYFPEAKGNEMLFIDSLSGHWYNLYNEKLGIGCALAWDSSAFPYLWLWQENYSSLQEPFNGKTRAIALEPQASNVPILTNAHKENQAPLLHAGESKTSFLTFALHHRSDRVVFVSEQGLLQYKA